MQGKKRPFLFSFDYKVHVYLSPFSLDVPAKHEAYHHYPTLHTLSKFVSVKALSSTKSGWLHFWQKSLSRSCCSCCAGDEATCSPARQLESSCMRMLFPLFNTLGNISTGFYPNYSWAKRTVFTYWEHLCSCFTVLPLYTWENWACVHTWRSRIETPFKHWEGGVFTCRA